MFLLPSRPLGFCKSFFLYGKIYVINVERWATFDVSNSAGNATFHVLSGKHLESYGNQTFLFRL